MAYRFIRFPGGKPKAVTFSYDDGCDDDRRLAAILDTYHMKATFNLNSFRLLQGENGLKTDDALDLLARGHEIAVHGKHHVACGIASATDGIRDVLACREELENALGTIIRGMAYPDTGITQFANGTDYETVKTYLRDLGIVYARTLGGDNDRFALPSDWYAWMPTAHHNNPDIMTYIDRFVSLDLSEHYWADRQARLFYIWGHAYEFTHCDNWKHLEAICSRLAGRDDIWYATNMQIYEYIRAFHSLIRSADGKRVYNPTLQDVWVDVNKDVYCIRSGEELKIQ